MSAAKKQVRRATRAGESNVTRLPMGEIAARIGAYLQRFERDPKINVRDAKYDTTPYYVARAGYNGGARIWVCYVTYQGRSTLTRDEAERYLAWLDAGNVGRHYEALRS